MDRAGETARIPARATRSGARRGRVTTRPSVGLLAAVWLAAAAAGCEDGRDLETRTFELAHLEPTEATEMVAPYVYTDRPGSPGAASQFPGGITVRETPDNLDKIGRVLSRFDRPKPAVRLHFQIIEADGVGEPDPRIAGIESALRELFRFEGYRLVTEAQMGAVEGSSSLQALRQEGTDYGIRAEVERIRSAGERGTVELHVALFSDQVGEVIQTSMSVPVGQTVVLGSAQARPGQRALILTVRPEFIEEIGPTGGGDDEEGQSPQPIR